ncbi:MAG: IspD/TarI family cytidylyltransferase, partial [Tepidisphaeraceae bacterium]
GRCPARPAGSGDEFDVTMPSVAVILPAAGRSVRYGRDKLAETIAGRSVYARSAGAFLDRLGRDVACVVFVLPPGADPRTVLPPDLLERVEDALTESADALAESASDAKRRTILFAHGGASRAESVLNGVRAVPAEIPFVAVHDAARPLVSATLIERKFAHAIEHGSAIPALPVKLTIKQARGPLPAKVQQTLPRASLWEMQTPQVVRRQDLLSAYAACQVPLEQVTDDAQELETAGLPVWLVPGEEANLKITTPQDLRLAEQLLAE